MTFAWKRLQWFCRNKQGIAAIEFSMAFSLFIVFIFLIFEVSRFMFISSAVDLTLAESARITSTRLQKNIDYAALFHDVVEEQSRTWSLFIDENRYQMKVLYCGSIDQAIKGDCGENNPAGKVLAIYEVRYDYRPVLFNGVVPGSEQLLSALRNALTRRLINVQEYEREEIFRHENKK